MRSLRFLLRTPGFALTVVLILALGIGLATAVFTVSYAVLLRPLPVRDQGRIVALWGENQARTFLNFPLPIAHARDFARETHTLEQVAFFAYEGAWTSPIKDGDRLIPLALALVSGNYFSVLGASPVLGRALEPADDVAGADPVVVLSHAAWQRHFGGDPAILGRTLELHVTGGRYRIAGVMPAGLDHPRGTDLWGPIAPFFAHRGTLESGDVDVIARLRPGVSAMAARDELTAFFRREPYQRWGGAVVAVATANPELVSGDARPAVMAFSAATILLLVITCINVANLLLVRGLARAREVTVRAALGAPRRVVIGQLLGEHSLLAAAGGTLGVLFARGLVRAFEAVAPASLPRVGPIQLDALALGAALAITLGTLLLFGLFPAVLASRVDLLGMLRASSRPTARTRRTADVLVGAQVALAVLVLSAAGLLGRSWFKLHGADLSFEPSRLMIGELTVRVDAVDGREKQVQLLDRLLGAVQAVPGVEAVSPVTAAPFSGHGGWDGRPSAIGQTAREQARNPMLNMDVVTPDYFRVFGLPILAGRGFRDADREGAPRVVVLSQSAARHYWPAGQAIGQALLLGGDTATVIGVVPDTRYRDLRIARASIYYPFAQSRFPFAPTTLAIRSRGPVADLIPQVRSALSAVDPAVEVVGVTPFIRYLEAPLAQPRFNALLLGVFAAGSVVLVAVGLYGVLAHVVKHRTRELALRMALGATAGKVAVMVLRRGLAIAAVGLAVGLGATLIANRMVVAMLYGVGPNDLVTMGSVVALILGVAALASSIPARAGSTVSPAVALRADG